LCSDLMGKQVARSVLSSRAGHLPGEGNAQWGQVQKRIGRGAIGFLRPSCELVQRP